MIVFGATWSDVLSYNLRQAGALWSAWLGGALTVSRDDEYIYRAGDGEARIHWDEPEPVRKRAHLTLVE